MAPPRIADGQPMSQRTIYRRLAARGETKPWIYWPFKEEFFASWSDDLAWLVGLVWSDGCLHGRKISINSKDRDLIETVAALIESPQRVIPHSSPGCWQIVFGSPAVVQFFRNVGLIERKSLTVGWPVIPEAYEMSFLRGVIDGDGMVRLAQDRPGQRVADLQVRIYTASWAFKQALMDCLSRYGIKATALTRAAGQSGNPLFIVCIVEQRSLRHLYQHLYPNPEVPCLHRKQAPFSRWMTTPRFPPGRPR